MTNMWDDRYLQNEFVFGKSPSQFVMAQAASIAPNSKIYLPADGEGRNSCFLASLGHEVYASDYSIIGQDKAKRLARELGVNVNFEFANIEEMNWPENEYDAIFAVFIQFSPPNIRENVFEGMKKALKKGGKLYLHGYNPKQIEYKTGGPSMVENLYDKQTLQNSFNDFEIKRLEEYDLILEEGAGHNGISALIDLIAIK
jgi:SAM-dependent methyltransferase